jgi:hypothetical protein
MPPDGMTLFGTTNFRGDRRRFGIRDRDRLFHTFILGKTGVGKSTLLETFIAEDLRRGHGLALLDPHGDLALRVLEHVPRERLEDVVYVNPADLDFPVPFNVLETVDPQHHHLVASALVSILRRFWVDFWGPRTEYIIANAVYALLETPGATLLEISRLLVDDAFRGQIVGRLRNPAVAHFWAQEFAAYPPAFRQEVVAAPQNKIGQFLLTPVIRNIVGQRRNLFELRRLLDEGKILIVNLSKGQLGEDTAALLGSMFLTRLMLATFTRADTPEELRRPFFLYVDEFASFGTAGTVATLLAEARKYRVGLVLVAQYLAQIDRELRGALFGNAATAIAFRVAGEDAEYLAREFGARLTVEDFTTLPHHEVYLRLAVGGVASPAFSATTIRTSVPPTSYVSQIVKLSRERYARPRAAVEQHAEALFLASRGLPTPGRTPWPRAKAH